MQRSILVGLVLLVTGAACLRASDATSEATEVSGTVKSANGDVVAGARVRAILLNPVVTAMTNAQGGFTISVPQDRVRGLAIVATDAADQMGFARVPWELTPGQAIDLRIEMRETKLLEVTVTGHRGHAVAGAQVGALVEHIDVDAGETSDAGVALLRVPVDAKCQAVYARKPGLGFDYRLLESERHPMKSPGWPAANKLDLKLEPTKSVQIHASAENGQSLEGISFRLWYLRKPTELEEFNLGWTPGLYSAKTDSRGVAHFDDVPSWSNEKLVFWPDSDGFVRRQVVWDPVKHAAGMVEVTLPRVVSISGQVVFADGRAAPNIIVRADGSGYSLDSCRGQTTTGDDGSFRFDAYPNELCMLAVDDANWGASVIDSFVVRPGMPVENLKFILQPATRVHGRVVVGTERRPIANQRLYLRQEGRDLASLEGTELPNPQKLRNHIQPSIGRWATTDIDGRYEFHVGPGEYILVGPSQVEPRKLRISDETELVCDFELPRAERGPFSGIVIDVSSGQPVPLAEITGVYRHQLAGRALELIADDAGKFQGERAPHRVVLCARSPDGQLGGILEIGPDDAETRIELHPLGTAQGQIIDEATGRPLANHKLEYGVRVHIGDDNAAFADYFGGSATTDDNGRFELTRLIAGSVYHIVVPSDETSSRGVGTVTIASPEIKQLGKLLLAKPYRPPTIEERIADTLRGDAQTRYQVAKVNAQTDRQRVAVLLVDPSSARTTALMDLRFNDLEVRRALDSYRLVLVDATTTEAKKLAAALEVRLAEAEALPQLILRDAEGAALAAAEASELCLDGQINKSRLIDLLRANALEPLDARTLLADALVEARKSNRRVLVQETAVWCGPCHLLTEYLEKHRAIWQKDYLWIRIDERWTNSSQVMEGIRSQVTEEIKPGVCGGIPWMAILDADGRLMATSNGPKGENIGYPSTPARIEHFLRMLRDTLQRMTEDDLRQLHDGLEKKGS